MHIYPAIDLLEGQVVRLTKGDYEKKTVYSDQPDAMASVWEKDGCSWLHVVDLDGAKTGIMKNLPSIRAIRKAVKCRIQMGGGVRKIEDIETLIAEGVDRVILGTKALEKTFFESVIHKFKSKIAVGLDIRDDKVQTHGWIQGGVQTLQLALKEFNQYPLETIIYTDIQRDGMLSGPNFVRLSEILNTTKSKVILSGGVSTLQDIQSCKKIVHPKFDGVIVGKALYDKKFTLKEAFEVLK